MKTRNTVVSDFPCSPLKTSREFMERYLKGGMRYFLIPFPNQKINDEMLLVTTTYLKHVSLTIPLLEKWLKVDNVALKNLTRECKIHMPTPGSVYWLAEAATVIDFERAMGKVRVRVRYEADGEISFPFMCDLTKDGEVPQHIRRLNQFPFGVPYNGARHFIYLLNSSFRLKDEFDIRFMRDCGYGEDEFANTFRDSEFIGIIEFATHSIREKKRLSEVFGENEM